MNQHHAYTIRTLFFLIGSVFAVVQLLSTALAQAPPITPSGLNTQVSGPIAVGGQTQFNITGGTRPGGGPNLFHSFGNFNVPNNNIANFLNDTGLPTSNILGRVTGGNISNIFGTIQTTGFGNANLFLMNPAGFLFGPTAMVNVGGMVAFTTADYLKLADGAKFNAIPNAAADALLSAAPIAAFGFLGSNPGAITVQGSQLSVTNETGISLVGGDITVQSAQLSAPAGQINLVSVGKPQHPNKGGEMSASTFSPSATSGFKSMGTVTIADGTTLTTSTDGVSSGLHGGTVLIRGGKLIVANSNMVADGIGNTLLTSSPGGSIEVHADTVTLDHATLSANSDRNNAGQIHFMDLETLSSTESSLTANALNNRFDFRVGRGSITIGTPETKSIALNSTAIATRVIDASSSTPGPTPGVENPGITLTAKSVSINGGSLDASAGFHDVMSGGSITLNGDQIALTNQASLRSTDTTGGGGAGTVIVQGLNSTNTGSTSAKSVTIDSSSLNVFSVGGPGGTIAFHADNVTLNNATLAANSSSRGGTINLADVGTLKSTNSTLRNEGEINGGTIILGSLATRSITLQDTILSVRGRNAGTIDITAAKFFKSVRSMLDASSPGGVGGTISIHAGRLKVLDGSTVNARGAGPGQDGTIHFEFGKKLTVKDSVVTPDATIVSGWEAK